MRVPPVEKGVPIETSDKYRKLNRYPWKAMEINDSFLFPSDTYAQLAYSLCKQASRGGQKKFVTRRVIEDGIERFRCWRVL